ncbi:MAG TPA: hypothetical protein VIG44_13050 [Thermomicrobiales bacterium]
MSDTREEIRHVSPLRSTRWIMARDHIARALRAFDHVGDLPLLRGLGDGLFLLLDIVHVAGNLPTLANAYTFVAPTATALSINAVEPGVGLTAGGARVRVRGSGFTAGVTVTNAVGDVSTLTNGYGYIATTPGHRAPGTASPTGGQPPAPLPTGGRKGPGAPNTPGTAGIAGGGVTSPDPSPAHR